MFLFFSINSNDSVHFNKIYPLSSFKSVVDACVRSYSDVLLFQDRVGQHEKVDDLLDILVGRLMRLQSYLEQLRYGYQKEATVSFEELEYLMHMLEYLEVTVAENKSDTVTQGLNAIIESLKDNLKKTLNPISFIPMLQIPCWYLPVSHHSLRLT